MTLRGWDPEVGTNCFGGSICVMSTYMTYEFWEKCILQILWPSGTLASFWKWPLVLWHEIRLPSLKGNYDNDVLNRRLVLCLSEPHIITSHSVSYLCLWYPYTLFSSRVDYFLVTGSAVLYGYILLVNTYTAFSVWRELLGTSSFAVCALKSGYAWFVQAKLRFLNFSAFP